MISWGSGPRHPRASHDEVHVWAVALDVFEQVPERLLALLNEDERARADRFVFPRHRRRYIVARATLRELLGGYTGLDPRAIPLAYGEHGKPRLADDLGSSLRFNVSHSHEMALIAFCDRRELGVDVEHVRDLRDAKGLAERFFSEAERRAFRDLPDDLRLEGFFNAWTRKEAYIKALGTGLFLVLDRFDVSLTPGEPARLLAVRGDADGLARWDLCEVTGLDGYAAAMVVERGDWKLRCWRCDLG